MTKSASQHKAAPRKTAPQQPETQSSRKNGSSQGQSSKGQTSKAKQGKPQAGKAPQPVVKQRSTLWTIILALVSIGAVIDAIVPLAFHRQDTYDINHPIVLGGAILVGLLGLGGVVGLWLWKRWGLYLFVASVVGSIAVGLVVLPELWVAFHALIPLLILGYGLSRDNMLARLE
jgi:hypothetical protein